MPQATTRKTTAKKRQATEPMRRCAAEPRQWQRLDAAPTGDLAAVAAAFGPARFTPEEQAAEPTAQRTRIVKDVLSVGKKLTSYSADGTPEFWDVTPQTLQTLASQYKRGRELGYAANLGKTHGDDETSLIHPDDLIASLDAAAVVGDRIWVSAYVNAEQYAYLAHNSARKVSICAGPYTDGKGNSYPLQFIHVAVTDMPVETGQGPFRRLASQPGASSMNLDFDTVKGFVNMLLEALGIAPLGADVTADNIESVMQGIAHMLGGSATTAEPKAGGEALGDTGEALMANPAQLSRSPLVKRAVAAALQPQQAELKRLSAEVAALKTQQASGAAKDWDAFTASLGEQGVDPKLIEGLTSTVKLSQYNPDVIAAQRSLAAALKPTVEMKKLSRGLAKGTVPKQSEATGRLTDDEIDAELLAQGIPPAYRKQPLPAATE